MVKKILTIEFIYSLFEEMIVRGDGSKVRLGQRRIIDQAVYFAKYLVSPFQTLDFYIIRKRIKIRKKK